MDIQETIEFTRIVQGLANLYPRLMQYAATTAVNFFKERIVYGRDINNVAFKPRSKNRWVEDKRPNRAILVDKAILKRDIQKIEVREDYAIVGTTRISAPYAKAQNEGFKGTVTQHVKPFTRNRYSRHTTRSGNVKKTKTGTVQVKAFTRRIKQDIPQRQFMGNSPFLDRRIQAEQTRLIIETIKKFSS